MRSSKVILLVVGGFVFAGNATHAQFTQQGSKLVGTGAAGFSEQGASVSLSSGHNTTALSVDPEWLCPGAWHNQRTSALQLPGLDSNSRCMVLPIEAD